MSPDTVILLPDGTPARMGCIQPETQRFGAVTAWSDANPVLSEAECEDHDDYAGFTPPIINQPFSNCTNASAAKMAECGLWVSTGIKPPTLSQTWLWAHWNGGSTKNGAMCRDVVDKLRTWGIPTDALFPASKYSIPSSGSSPELLADAKTRCALEVYQCENWADIRSSLARRFWVYYGIVIGRAYFNTPATGKTPPWDGSRINGHAMWLRGLTRSFGDLRAINVNSWGLNFAKAGISYMSADYFWATSGNYINLDAYAVRSFAHSEAVPTAE